jgi:hypothetical protein
MYSLRASAAGLPVRRSPRTRIGALACALLLVLAGARDAFAAHCTVHPAHLAAEEHCAQTSHGEAEPTAPAHPEDGHPHGCTCPGPFHAAAAGWLAADGSAQTEPVPAAARSEAAPPRSALPARPPFLIPFATAPPHAPV